VLRARLAAAASELQADAQPEPAQERVEQEPASPAEAAALADAVAVAPQVAPAQQRAAGQASRGCGERALRVAVPLHDPVRVAVDCARSLRAAAAVRWPPAHLGSQVPWEPQR